MLNDSVPELNLRDIDLSVEFLGKKLNFPLLINALTGGTDQAQNINRDLAYLARKHGLAMAVGSQSIAISNPELKNTFTVVREYNPDGIIIANLGANSDIKRALEAVKMVSADALQLHFNVPQELAMAEGDRNFKGILENVRRIVGECPVPVIAKEVGFGFSRESVKKLYDAGVKIFDNGGKGGTSFTLIEDKRNGKFNNEFNDWGISTTVSLAEIVSLDFPIQLIASGGIRTAVDAAKAISMGADLIGIAAPFLKVLLAQGVEELDAEISEFKYRLQAVFLMTGSRNRQEIRKKPLVITGETAEWLRARGIDPGIWARR